MRTARSIQNQFPRTMKKRSSIKKARKTMKNYEKMDRERRKEHLKNKHK